MLRGKVDARITRVIDDVVRRAVKLVQAERIWLFGSQAAGTAHRGSDIDLAVQIPAGARQNWSRFVLEAAEEVPALIDIDLVDTAACSPALATEIARTGRLVYDANLVSEANLIDEGHDANSA